MTLKLRVGVDLKKRSQRRLETAGVEVTSSAGSREMAGEQTETIQLLQKWYGDAASWHLKLESPSPL